MKTEFNVASCGLGVNSIAGIIDAAKKGIVFDEILFANTGDDKKFGERKITYEYLDLYFNQWLKKNNQPEVKILHSVNQGGDRITLYEECYKLKTLPAIVFGFKTCSQRFKAAPQVKFLNNNSAANKILEDGGKIVKWIFYDADEPHSATPYEDAKSINKYFLIENDIGRYECEQIIMKEGLPLPPKSSCKFCPSMKPHEIITLYETERDGFYEAIELERNALNGDKMNAIKGLGRNWAWWDLIVAYRYFNFFKKNLTATKKIDKRVLSMIKRIRRSQPRKLTSRIIKTESSKEIVCSLFSNNSETPCGCYDG